MVLSRNYQDINSVYDFYEGIIGNISWDNNLTDLIVTVYYFFNEPNGLKDKDIVLRFKNCYAFNMCCKNMIFSVKEFDIVTPHPEIQSIVLNKSKEGIEVQISTNYDSNMISVSCDEVWIETVCESIC